MGYEALSRTNPGLIMLRISGYGQTGPYRERPALPWWVKPWGHALPECRAGSSTRARGCEPGDTLAALHGVIGILTALQARHASVDPDAPKGRGQVVDGFVRGRVQLHGKPLPEFSAFGRCSQPGSALPGIAPSNAYSCADGMVVIGGNGDPSSKRLMQAIGEMIWRRTPNWLTTRAVSNALLKLTRRLGHGLMAYGRPSVGGAE